MVKGNEKKVSRLEGEGLKEIQRIIIRQQPSHNHEKIEIETHSNWLRSGLVLQTNECVNIETGFRDIRKVFSE